MDTQNYIIEFMSVEWIRNTLISISLILIILFLSNNFFNKDQKLKIVKILSLFMIIMTITDHSRNIMNGLWNVSENLPLHMCGLTNLIACSVIFTKLNKRVFEFFYFAGIIGGIQAFLTPQINNFDGSTFEYISYHTSHAGIILIPIFLLMNLNYSITKFSWFRVWVYLNIIIAFIIPLNFQIDSNYMYLASPPNVDNPLLIGDWPYYIFFWEIIVILFTYTLYVVSTKKFI
tara:strand:+ start:330 stop:1025 length:696 start_codon:yes stop_codon:yes gene_type:complete